MHKLLFLLGGSEKPFYAVAERFIPAAGGRNGNIALLISGSPGWEEYVSHNTIPWKECGLGRYEVIVPDEHGLINHESVIPILEQATGIFIGGGYTPTGQRLFATGPIRQILQSRYAKGVPFAGLSAGALIIPSICAIPPEDTGEIKVTITSGLALLSDMIVGFHFSKCHALLHVLEAMKLTKTANGIGIDEAACVELHDGHVADVFGGNAYKILMHDFRTQAYTITPIF
jgi:cyanophycinase